MKKSLSFAFASLLCLALVSCGAPSSTSYQAEDNSYSQTVEEGTPGFFSLVSPSSGAQLSEAPTFEWTASENATYYTLEIASSEAFLTNNDAYVYYKHDYISATHYAISAALNQKNVTYYWKVTAHCGAKTLLCNNVLSFFLKSIDLDEVDFPIGEATDWSIHEAGAPVDVSINNSDFFGNGKESVCLKFTMEQTKSIGWIVATKTVELDTYGTDALYLRFFYSGQDATAFIRLRDNDGEFWRHKIQLANNSKQVCILPFSEFTQDTQLVTVNNHVFDYFHIKYLEVVFEQTWGDGVCLLSQISAIKKANYASLFIKNLNFKDYDTSLWKWENDYNFGSDVSEDGSTYTLHYDQAANALNAVGMASKGYGFAKIYVNQFFDTGDMVHLQARYTGSSAGNLSFRLQEEDGDYWYYLQSFSSLSTTDYTDIYIPFEAFGATYLGGNGRREFSFILQLQFGLTNMFGSGTLSYKDVSIVSRNEVASIDCGPRNVGEDGLIENFDAYTTAAQPFYQWDLSSNNKDEFITLDNLKTIGSGNVFCGKMAYKADMAPAIYSLDVNVNFPAANALSLWLKDASLKSDNSVFAYLESVSASCSLALTLSSGALYTYQISAVSKVWTEYRIPFSTFSLASGSDALSAGAIAKVSLAFSYVYKTSDGTAYPTYMMSNPVYVDNLCFSASGATSEEETPKEKAIKADVSDISKATIEDGENYATSAELLGAWSYGNAYEGNQLELSDEVSSLGGSHSLKMNYLSYTSVSYVLPTTVDASVASTMKPKGINVDLKGDGKATVYINLFILSGSSLIQVRKTIEANELSTSWAHYEIGFAEFVDWVSSAGANVNVNNITSLFKISFGIVNADYSASAIYMDNLRLDNAITRTTDAATIIS